MTALPRRLASIETTLAALALEDEQRESDSPRYDWERVGRPEQQAPPGDWGTWLLLGGRGSGKTRAICEWARQKAISMPGSRGAIIGPTVGDVRDILVEGRSGILAVHPVWERPEYSPSTRRLEWKNGSQATVFSSDIPDRLRGHSFDWAIADELRSWRRGREAWANLQLSMRAGALPQTAAATTPRPSRLIGELLRQARDGGPVVVGSMSVWDNESNLSASFFSNVVEAYRGTSLEQQELHGKFLDSLPGSLWTPDMFRRGKPPEKMASVCIAVDPATTSGDDADECGIVVVGRDRRRVGWILSDLSLRGSPSVWAMAVAGAAEAWHAKGIVAEANMGGELVADVLKNADEDLPPVRLIHASKSKAGRAEPVALLYEKSRVFHAEGADLEMLEEQLTCFTRDGYGGGGSPDRADACIHGLTALLVEGAALRRHKGKFSALSSSARRLSKPNYAALRDGDPRASVTRSGQPRQGFSFLRPPKEDPRFTDEAMRRYTDDVQRHEQEADANDPTGSRR